MGEEVDAVLIKKVKLTQEVLGNFIRRPPLTEKHLVKPPFRFIHDIVMSVIDNTGFLYGLYEGSELDATTITTRETKTAFMQKLVDCLRLTTGDEVDVKISKILAGQEPGKTNDLLICLGNALAGNINSDKAVQQITGKDLNSPNPTNPVKSKASSSEISKEKKKNPNPAVSKIKEANSPYSTSVQQKKPGKPPMGNAKKGPPEKSKPTNISPTKGKQSKPAISSSPPKAPPKPTSNRQGSSDRLAAAQKGKQGGPYDKSPTKPPSSQGIKDGRRTSVRGSIDDGPPSLGEGDGGNIPDETRVGGGGSRRESLTSMTAAAAATTAPPTSRERESRSMSKYGGRAGPSQRGSISGPSGGTGDDVMAGAEGAFMSTEAHADDLEQQEFMGELEFLLKKHGYEGETGRHESDNENDNDHDNDEGIESIEGAKTETLNDNNIPGYNQKDPLPRKSSVDNSNTGQGQIGQGNEDAGVSAVESVDNELNSNTDNMHDNESDDNQTDTILSPSPLPKSRQSATPTKRVKTANLSISPRTPSASTSALSLSNSALGRTLSPTRSSSTKLSPILIPTVVLPDINEKPLLRPPSARPHTSQMRQGGPATTMSIARPPSARPAPPRPKTALFQDKDENAFRPTTAKVANVLLDAEDADDDNNYIVHEAPDKNSGQLQLDETADLGISGNLMEENIDMILDPEQRGLLVTQMLDAQNKLEDGSRIAPANAKKTDIERDPAMGDKDRMRWREMTVTEVEKLKNLMQLMARNANPLGKLMDFVQEDVDAMQRDLNKWREESRKLDSALEAAQEETERSLEPLRRKMGELDEAIQDRQDSIAATKMTIYRQEERIRKVLTGLDRVKPRNGNEPIITSADLHNLVDLDENYEYASKNKVYFKKSNAASPGMNPSSPSPV